jgi:apolipoprotein D and lipocalin family protein
MPGLDEGAMNKLLGLLLAALPTVSSLAQTPQPGPLRALPSLEVAPYMGTWYQVLWIPNRFQRQCVADTSATYRNLGNGTLEVVNRCRTADGSIDDVVGVARPPAGVSRVEGGRLLPARLEVSFLPAWLRWTGIGWGDYWVVDLASDGRYAIVSEATRQYLWVLSRQPALTPGDDAAIRERLQALGFELAAVQVHPHAPR